jgi:aminoglycoside phosphotransferase (APT) family kinase protein
LPTTWKPIYLAYNFFRLAAIFQGIIGRVRDGTATNDHALAKAQLVRPLARMALSFAQQAGA